MLRLFFQVLCVIVLYFIMIVTWLIYAKVSYIYDIYMEKKQVKGYEY